MCAIPHTDADASLPADIVLRSRRGALFWSSTLILAILDLIVWALLIGNGGGSMSLVLAATITVVFIVIIVAELRFSYTFDSEKVTVRNPFATSEPPAFYDRIWKVVDTDRALLVNIHGLSADAILIHYDRGHFVCISPDDKELAMAILRERCRNAVFETDRKDRGRV